MKPVLSLFAKENKKRAMWTLIVLKDKQTKHVLYKRTNLILYKLKMYIFRITKKLWKLSSVLDTLLIVLDPKLFMSHTVCYSCIQHIWGVLTHLQCCV